MLIDTQMIRLEVELSPDSDDIEHAVTSAVHELCGKDIIHLAIRLREDGNINRMFGSICTDDQGRRIPLSIKDHTGNGQTVLGLLLSGEPVALNIRGSEVVVERSNVLCNILTLLLPNLPDDTMASLFSDWSLTGARGFFHRAVCEYYLKVSQQDTPGPHVSLGGALASHCIDRVCNTRYSGYVGHTPSVCHDTLEELVDERDRLLEGMVPAAGSTCTPEGTGAGAGGWMDMEPVADANAAQQFIRVLFRMLTANLKHAWYKKETPADICAHCSLTHRFGLIPPMLNLIKDPAVMLHICFAAWYLSSAEHKDIATCFQTALAGGLNPPANAGPNESAFLHVLLQHSHALLTATAPHCKRCDSGKWSHCGGGCGSKELISCLTPLHSLQLLELLVCHGHQGKFADEAIVWSDFGL